MRIIEKQQGILMKGECPAVLSCLESAEVGAEEYCLFRRACCLTKFVAAAKNIVFIFIAGCCLPGDAVRQSIKLANQDFPAMRLEESRLASQPKAITEMINRGGK